MMFAPKKERKRLTWISFITCLKCYDISIQHVRVGLQKMLDNVAVWFAMKPTSTFLLHVFLFFFFFSSPQQLILSTVNSAYMNYSRSHKLHFLAIFLLKMGPTTLFTHLKIISLQCFQFQFSVSVKISSIQTHPQFYLQCFQQKNFNFN